MRIEVMESSLVEYFELNEADDENQDAPLSEENFSSSEPLLSDNSTPLADAVSAEGGFPFEKEAENNVEEKPPEEVNQDTE